MAGHAFQRFLHDPARGLGDSGVDDLYGEGARVHDRTPLFLHHLEEVDVDPDAARELLLTRLDELVPRATAGAISGAAEALAAGRFRAPPEPDIEASPADPGAPATAWIRWDGDDEATGWPALSLAVLVEVHERRTRLVAPSPREPGYDLSLNRPDKASRRQLLQQAAPAFAVALARDLAADTAGALGAAPAQVAPSGWAHSRASTVSAP